MSKKISITVDRFGNSKLLATGFQGGECVKAMQPISDAIVGKRPQVSEHTAEFFDAENKLAERERA
jgi:hypothetical protein